MFRTSLLALLAPSFLLIACAADPSSPVVTGPDQEANSATKILESKLYDEPNEKANAFCDSFTLLTISKGPAGLTAKLENKLSPTSRCEIFVAPNARTFKVTESSSCGSKIYQGDGEGGGAIRVQDNATRICEDIRPSLIEVEEQVNGGARSLFGEPLESSGGDANPAGCAFGNRFLKVGERVPDSDGCNTCTCRSGGSVACTELFCG